MSQSPAGRRGISLLEVLISMFVLLFGLMGVAAIFPVGNHYAGRSDQYERGAALAGSAFADVKARGLLNPQGWMYPNSSPIYPNGIPVINTTIGDPLYQHFQLAAEAGHAFVIDPIGAAETDSSLAVGSLFPFNANFADGNLNPWRPVLGFQGFDAAPMATNQWPIRRVTWATPNPAGGGPIRMPNTIARSVFTLRDDLAVQLPTDRDRPGMQRWSVDANGSDDPVDFIPIARDNAGSYSWLATVVPTNFAAHAGMQASDPRHGSFLYDVSVAVMYKRQMPPSEESERMLQAELLPGGDLILFDPEDDFDRVEAAIDAIRPGRWILLAGAHPTLKSPAGHSKFLLRWYRLLSIDDEVQTVTSNVLGPRAGVNAMIDGPAWPAPVTPAGVTLPAVNLQAILLPGVVGVTTQTVRLNEE